MEKFLRVGVLQAVLIERLGRMPPMRMSGGILQVHLDAGNLRQLGPKFLNDLVRVQFAFGRGLSIA